MSSAGSTLYAWAKPVRLLPRDHTWVTTYDNRVTRYQSVGEVVAKEESYWFCWGDFHDSGGSPGHTDGLIGSQDGDLSISKCVCRPNLASNMHDDSCGTILLYAVDGVCHQLANQVLWSTGGFGRSALTVAQARGYGASSFLYGSYGFNRTAWLHRVATCQPTAQSSGTGTNLMATSLPPDFSGDEFEKNARSVLSDDSEKFSRLLMLRQDALTEVTKFRARLLSTDARTPTAEEMNHAYNNFFDRAAKLLGRESFMKIFGVAPAEPVNLVDAAVFARATRR